MTDFEKVWQEIIAAATPRLPEGAVDIWLKTCVPIEMEDGFLALDVANDFIKVQIQDRFMKILEETMVDLGYGTGLRLSVGDGENRKEQERAEKTVRPQSSSNVNGLNPNYLFSSFVVGKSNRLAHAASLAVAENPGAAYNPLFIWGGVGLGKTHLMHAIGHHALQNNRNLKVSYVSSEKFTNELITSIKNNRTSEFRNRYRTMDLLLIDDIQFLAGKESTQEEFFHTFNSLHNDKKQIVLSSDRPPKDIKSIEDRLVSRFEWGLVTDIQSPDYETRIAILTKKAEFRNYAIPYEVVIYLAQNVPSNIRELEGALNRVIACAELNSEPITVENASEWLKDIVRHTSRGPVSIDLIQQIVAEECSFTVEDLRSSKRTSEIALARQIAMYICRKHTESSLQQIGTAFNKKDHTTVIHAQKKIEQMLDNNQRVKTVVDNVEKRL